jgi:hypothetical protein
VGYSKHRSLSEMLRIPLRTRRPLAAILRRGSRRQRFLPGWRTFPL